MIIDGVNFNDEVIKRMTQEEFIAKHKDHLWQEKEKEVRIKRLAEAYELIAKKPPKTRKGKSE